MHIRGVGIWNDAGISNVYPKFKPPPSSKKKFVNFKKENIRHYLHRCMEKRVVLILAFFALKMIIVTRMC